MTGEAMRLGTDGGARIDLRIVDYQYPEIAGDGTGKDWDANWLVVAGDVVAEDGRGWSFLDPCLTSWEAREIGDWLRGVVDGSVTPTPLDGGGAGRLLAFTEPNLAFSFADRTDDAVVIRVYLSLESGPPWPTERGDYFLLVTMQVTHLALAIKDWDRMLAAHPDR
ncbi:hypothetical protein ND748_07660 [Frankia sp. AiPs1]|uniref:WapI family immunity protein n=1 Tax=Frankia sp. AiPs1 TaxID=573493 RepID=UPI002043ACEE|nr:hypothetical protein [Frankia sp. AiPs1]MCM3921542.1 hypothetical protein [Frankia sp. AiPs1]